MPKLNILGVMTGTSCDGLDASLIEFDTTKGPASWRPLWSAEAPYPSKLRSQVLAMQKPGARQTLKDMLAVDRDLGEWYGEALKQLISRHRQKPDLIANHGQTVSHFPAGRREGTTLQLGDPTRLAARTGISVASHFRNGDMAVGGEGAPLIPAFHRMIAQKLKMTDRGIAIHNIGGISNLTYVSGTQLGRKRESMLAFDTGPGNIWIDAAAEIATSGRMKMDRDGKLARNGMVDEGAVARVLKSPYFKRPAPKSTGRDDFPFEMLKAVTRARGEDLVATATAVTADSIAQAYEQEVLSKGRPLEAVLVCGGGAKNPTLLEWIQDRLPSALVAPISLYGFDAQWIESQGFACFGYLALAGAAIGGEWTGAEEFAPPAHITPGKNWGALMRKLGARGMSV